ncbi:MAG: hypothetical protein JJU13_01435 [Balneolaceae bacterium]|nr:hypothetical protein [Balneolaceae bacterium]
MRYFLIGAIFCLLPISAMYAQTDRETWVKVSYIQLEADKISSFLEKVDDWQAIEQQYVDNGNIDAWRLYRVNYSSNHDQTYNFVSVRISGDLSSLQTTTRPNSGDLLQLLDRNPAKKYTAHSEIWSTQARVYHETADPPSRYKNTNFMRAEPASLEEYLELEVDIAKPLHQNQTDNNRMDGWNFYQLTFPTGTSVAYNFITADYYNSLDQIDMGITREVIEEVHPEMDVDEFEDFADSIRERAWSDLWELLEYAH